ncbi:hypothetical protein MATL_G00007640 [Megalops atlanticus]|uniref:Gypsy retrotransposon integrase-like protein 1 n=1 Tax=Megalops atlanticus TaxID=7932 RepID=A0A9D3QKT9_MEGAT|nr:hypothetical protein MATL_G00007640 [Megalops atlanticus]
MRDTVLRLSHGTAGAGHYGVNKTLGRLRERFYWGRCRRDVATFCIRCDVCTAKKGPTDRSRAPLQQLFSGSPMERVAIDVLGPFPRSEAGNRYVLIAMDYFTKWPEAYAIPSQETAVIVDRLLEGLFSRFGVPESLHSDQGRNFESQVFAEVCRRLGIEKTRTTPLHPQSDGLVERFNRTLATQLALLTSEHQRDWDCHLPLVLLSYRTAVQESTGFTPAALMLGRELRTPADLVFGRLPDWEWPSTPGLDYVVELQSCMDRAHHLAREHIQGAGIRQKCSYDTHCAGRRLEPGEVVWVYNPRRRKGQCPKLESDWEGPCLILDCLSDVVYRVRLHRRPRTVVLHRDRLAPYRGTAEPPTVSPRLRRRISPQGTVEGTPGTALASPTAGAGSPLQVQDNSSPSALPSAGTMTPRRGSRHRRAPRRLQDFEWHRDGAQGEGGIV